MSVWHRVAAEQDIGCGVGREVVVGDRVLALFRLGDEIIAIDGICPHAGGPLATGEVSHACVTCPWHGWQFDLRTGQHCLSTQIRQERYPVQQRPDGVYVETPE